MDWGFQGNTQVVLKMTENKVQNGVVETLTLIMITSLAADYHVGRELCFSSAWFWEMK